MQPTPTRAAKIKKGYKTLALLPILYTEDEALALFVNAEITKS
jgi:hypothetical protein